MNSGLLHKIYQHLDKFLNGARKFRDQDALGKVINMPLL